MTSSDSQHRGSETGGVALEARVVVKRYGSTTALGGVSVEVPARRIHALVGESGSGKSTLLRCFNRMVEPDSGRVSVGPDSVSAMDAVALRRRTGYVQQEGGLLPHWSVLRNVGTVPWLTGDPDPLRPARSALEQVGLDPERFGTRWPRELSGGQRQRVAIARAVAALPSVLLLDEPFGALDAITRGEMQDWFGEFCRGRAMTVLLVTHDLAEAERLADRIVVLRDGRVEQEGTPEELRSRPATPYVATLWRWAGRG